MFKEYLSPPIPNAILVLIFFFCGLVIAYMFGLSSRFKAKRTIKRLNKNITTHTTEVDQLKSEINKLKDIEKPVDRQADTLKLETDTTPKISEESKADADNDKSVKLDATAETRNPAPKDAETPDEKRT